MNLDAVKYVYLLGAGGIGMSALGRYFMRRGIPVGGYDKTPTALTDELTREGMKIVFGEDWELLPGWLKGKEDGRALVIYTPAIPKEHRQLVFLREKGWKLHKRAEVLGLISRAHPTIAVAGTHGKTTTSTLIAHILQSAGRQPVAFLGGLSANYATNYLPGTPASLLVAEADEYDRSFLHLHPDTAIITSVDADHLDIYGGRESLLDSFAAFARQTHPNGHIILKAGLELPRDIRSRAITYHTSLPADVRLVSYELRGDIYHFEADMQGERFTDLQLGQPGFHNMENALAAIAAARLNGVEKEAIREALASFSGVKRRFEYVIRRPDLVFIDDYAHHPEELNACIGSVRKLYPGRKLTGVFQPHLYSRTRDFLPAFADSLSQLDEVILLDIYPARELPIPGISSAVLLDKITIASKQLCSKNELPERVAALHPQVLLTLGAGDIDQLVEPISHYLNQTTHAV